MKQYIIGIDTGGTFTDAVILEKLTGKVIQTTKTPTTHHQLSQGIALALKDILGLSEISPQAIDKVAISSTLATNAVVEKKGARVAVLVIGYVKHFKLPVQAVLFMKGGHTITGEEEEPLDLDYLVSVVGSLKEEVDAFGVCSSMSFKNPTHELVAEKAIAMIAPKPVFCSHRISQQAGMQERAATAGLHAKLMPLMQEFIEGVNEAMNKQNIACPMVIIGGNAQPISSQKAVEHAGMTVASGPACTASFGSQQSQDHALIIDIGGTTTDITMIENGQPLFSAEGCHIGDWKTHVEAIKMLTRGIGGDSHVILDERGRMSIGPRRVTPISTSGCSSQLGTWLGCGKKSKCIDLITFPDERNMPNDILNILRDKGPCTLEELQHNSGISGIPLDKHLERLSRYQLIRETGFTPTDALHVLGKIDLGNTAMAETAATILGDHLNLSGVEFAQSVVDKTAEHIENIILEFVTDHYWQKSLVNFIATRNEHPVLGVDFSLKIPLVGIGAAVQHFLPQIAERLKTKVYFPNNYQVGNAIGAALTLNKHIDC